MKSNPPIFTTPNLKPGSSIAVLFCLFFLKQTLVLCSVPFDFNGFRCKGTPTSQPAMPAPCDGPIETITCGSSQMIELVGGGAGWNVNACGFNTIGAEQLYSFTATTSGMHTLQVTNEIGGGYVDYFYKAAAGGCSNLGWTCILDVGLATQVAFGPLTAGTTYYILLDSEEEASNTHTFQIECPMPFPPDGAATVSCTDQAVPPTPPAAVPTGIPACPFAFPVGPVITENPFPITCEGTRTYYYYYYDCVGNEVAVWSFVYTIEQQPFFAPISQALEVLCPAAAVVPIPPIVFTPCGAIADVAGPFINDLPDGPFTCEFIRQVTFIYSDCSGLEVNWTTTYYVHWEPFLVPVTDAALVTCPDDTDVVPIPPVLLSSCGEVMVPSMTVTPKPVCEGSRTYSFHYEDCAGNTGTWNFIYTVERVPFMVPVPNAALVSCPDDTDVVPIPPVLLSNCGEVMVPIMTVTPKPVCEGSRTYSFRYTDCEGNTGIWNFFYTVEYEDFVMPISIVGFVDCPSHISDPEPVAVKDNCGNLIVPTGPVVFNTYDASGCEVKRIYEWTYKDCEGNGHKWSWTFLFQYNQDFIVPADEEAYVTCLAHAVPPQHITVYDACGNALEIAASGVAQDIAPSDCTGWRRYTYTYIDCGGHSHSWNFTYHINDDEAPLGTCTGSHTDDVSVNVADLKCMEELPCPDDFDFLPKVEELLEAGKYFDVCHGKELVVKLDSWSDVWECSDPDGDGVFSFGRTFYFVIADACGNEYPSLCEVTYSGTCQPLQTFRASDWGIAGDLPGNVLPIALTDLNMIDGLIGNIPIKIGGNNRSLSITDAQCIIDLLPGMGGPDVLANCHQWDCDNGCNPMGVGGMKNSLAANAIAMSLNLRYNAQYKGLAMNDLRNQSLGCMEVHECILNCSATGCQLRLFDANGTMFQFPFTLGGLLDMANKYLDGGLNLTQGQKTIYGSAINQSLMNVNDYWSDGQVATYCESVAGATLDGTDASKATLPPGNSAPNDEVEFSLSPNPAGSHVRFSMAELPESQSVVLEVFNAVGKQVLVKDFGTVRLVSEQIDLHGLRNGLYFISLKAGGQHSVQKLMIGRE